MNSANGSWSLDQRGDLLHPAVLQQSFIYLFIFFVELLDRSYLKCESESQNKILEPSELISMSLIFNGEHY